MQAAIDLENRQQIMASATAGHREAMEAFLEKRPQRRTTNGTYAYRQTRRTPAVHTPFGRGGRFSRNAASPRGGRPSRWP